MSCIDRGNQRRLLQVVLGDFGEARELEKSLFRTRRMSVNYGTPEFCAPEAISTCCLNVNSVDHANNVLIVTLLRCFRWSQEWQNQLRHQSRHVGVRHAIVWTIDQRCAVSHRRSAGMFVCLLVVDRHRDDVFSRIVCRPTPFSIIYRLTIVQVGWV